MFAKMYNYMVMLCHAVNHIKIILTLCHTGEYICLLKSNMSTISLMLQYIISYYYYIDSVRCHVSEHISDAR